MSTSCRNGHPYPEDCPRDSKGWRECPECDKPRRERQKEANRLQRLEFTGRNNVPAIGDKREARLREAAAEWI